MEVFTKLQVNILFGENLKRMVYEKFMKYLLTRQTKLRDDEDISFLEECSVIIQIKLPSKLKDIGSFTILYSIGKINVGKILYDLGEGIK